MEYDNKNKGVLFKNDRKDKETSPDYKGSINVNGVEFWLSSWIREGAKGKFMSLSLTPKEQQSKPAAKPQRVQDIPDDDLDSDLPPF